MKKEFKGMKGKYVEIVALVVSDGMGNAYQRHFWGKIKKLTDNGIWLEGTSVTSFIRYNPIKWFSIHSKKAYDEKMEFFERMQRSNEKGAQVILEREKPAGEGVTRADI